MSIISGAAGIHDLDKVLCDYLFLEAFKLIFVNTYYRDLIRTLTLYTNFLLALEYDIGPIQGMYTGMFLGSQSLRKYLIRSCRYSVFELTDRDQSRYLDMMFAAFCVTNNPLSNMMNPLQHKNIFTKYHVFQNVLHTACVHGYLNQVKMLIETYDKICWYKFDCVFDPLYYFRLARDHQQAEVCNWIAEKYKFHKKE